MRGLASRAQVMGLSPILGGFAVGEGFVIMGDLKARGILQLASAIGAISSERDTDADCLAACAQGASGGVACYAQYYQWFTGKHGIKAAFDDLRARYGRVASRAVNRFQRKHNISGATAGVVDEVTRAKLNELYEHVSLAPALANASNIPLAPHAYS